MIFNNIYIYNDIITNNYIKFAIIIKNNRKYIIMSIQQSIIKYINKYFNYAKIATLEQIQKKIDTNVKITTQRYLKKLDYFTSISAS